MANTSIYGTNVAPHIPEIWSAIVIDEYVAASVIADKVDRRFESDLKYGDQVNRGTITKTAAAARTVNTDLTYNAATETWINCTINQDYYVFKMLEPMAKKQSMIDLISQYTKMASKALAETIDIQLGILFKDLNSGTRKGTINVDVEDDNLIDCKVSLDTYNVPYEDRAWIISSETWGSIMKIDKFVSLDYVKPNGETAVERAQLNRPIYGAPVFVSNCLQANAGNHNCALLQKEAIMLIIQQDPKVVTAWDTRRGCDTLLVEAFWGMVEARDRNGICLQGM